MEARDALGGRVLSSAVGRDRFDLGGTWFWPEHQPALARLVRDLDLETFEQEETGDLLIDSHATAPPTRIAGFRSWPPAVRIAGGAGALTEALASRLSAQTILSGRRVRTITAGDDHLLIEDDDSDGRRASHRVERVLLAVPPRLAATTIDFAPALPDVIARAWRDAPTWMAPHAKYVAVYEKPFWREHGLSGAAQSRIGPLGEIHDASAAHGQAALFGFFTLPANVRRRLSDEQLRSACRAQLVRLFGTEAGAPKAELLKDWSCDAYTATEGDAQATTDHPEAPPASPSNGEWRDRLVGIASEWSPRFPGYLAGAIDAATRGVDKLKKAS